MYGFTKLYNPLYSMGSGSDTDSGILSTVFIRIVAGAIIISRPIFPNKILYIFEKINLWRIILAESQKLKCYTITVYMVIQGVRK